MKSRAAWTEWAQKRQQRLATRELPNLNVEEMVKRDVDEAMRPKAERAFLGLDSGKREGGWPVFEAMLKAAGLPIPVYEFKFSERRRWRFDMAFCRLHGSDGRIHKVAIEVDGGAWSGGRHVRGQGFINDMEKLNAAAIAGWAVLRYTPEGLARAVDDLKAILG